MNLWLQLACTALGPGGVAGGEGATGAGETGTSEENVGPYTGDWTGTPGASDGWFREDAVPVLQITVPEASWEALLDDPFEYAPVTITWEGNEYGPYAMRTKGQNSWRPIDEKASLKLDFNRYDDTAEFQGMTKLTLNALNEDPSMMRERLAYLLFRAAGVPAARCTHIEVWLNGTYYGLYANLEAINRSMLSRWFDDEDGTSWEFADSDFRDELVDKFKLDFGTDDRTPLQGVADALEDPDPDSAIEQASAVADLDSFLRYWAVGAYVTHFDGYPYSDPGDDAHVFLDPDSGLLNWLPHGLDETWTHADSWVMWSNGRLAAVCEESADCQEGFWVQLRDVLDLADAINLLAYFDGVQAQIQEAADRDTHRPYTASEQADAQAALRAMIEMRRAELEDQD